MRLGAPQEPFWLLQARQGTDALHTLFSLVMFGWAVAFLIVALVAALFGFGGIPTFAADVARIIFFAAGGLFLIAAAAVFIRRRYASRQP